MIASYGLTRAVQSHPSWDAGDRAIYFTSDRGGHAATYRVRTAGADAGVVEHVAQSAFGVYDAEISPDGTQLAAFRLSPNGPQLVKLAPPPIGAPITAVTAPPTFAPGRRDTIAVATGASRRYSPFRTLVPRYWVPTLGTSIRNNLMPGFYTSGNDVVGRHYVAADGAWDATTGEFYGDAAWSYHGLGVPTISAAVAQAWTIFNAYDSNDTRVGEVARRNRIASLSRERAVGARSHECLHFRRRGTRVARLSGAPRVAPAPDRAAASHECDQVSGVRLVDGILQRQPLAPRARTRRRPLGQRHRATPLAQRPARRDPSQFGDRRGAPL